MSNISGILLAAGSSTRFGQAKLLHPFQDEEAIGIASARNLRKICSHVVAVVRPDDDTLINALSNLDCQVVINQQASQGMASSLIEGIKASAESSGWLITLADMPWVKPETMNSVKQQILNGASMVAPVFENQRGNPVGFSSKWKAELLKLEGDKGAKELLAKHANELLLVETDDKGILMDIDYPSDLTSR